VQLLDAIMENEAPERIVNDLVEAAETLSLNPTFHPRHEIFIQVKINFHLHLA
jgi:hypothetical protein